MSTLTVQECRSWPGKPRRFTIEKIPINGCPANKNSDLFHYKVGQIVEIGDMTNLRIAGVNIIMKRTNK